MSKKSSKSKNTIFYTVLFLIPWKYTVYKIIIFQGILNSNFIFSHIKEDDKGFCNWFSANCNCINKLIF